MSFVQRELDRIVVTISLPEGMSLGTFSPVAYYDKHMDCIRVLTHDRSVTEHRINGMLTLYECNHRGPFDPEYVGFTIKGIRHLFCEIGLPLDRVYKLADVMNKMVSHRPAATMAQFLKTLFWESQTARDLDTDLGELTVDFKEAI